MAILHFSSCDHLPRSRPPYSSTLMAMCDLHDFGWILMYRAFIAGSILRATVW